MNESENRFLTSTDERWLVKLSNREATIEFNQPSELFHGLIALEKYWLQLADGSNPNLTRSRACELLELSDVDTLSVFDINGHYDRKMFGAIRLYCMMAASDLVQPKTEETMMTGTRFSRILEMIVCCKELLIITNRMQLLMDPKIDTSVIPEEISLFKYSPMDWGKQTPYQNLLIYLLRCLQESGYRRYRSCCYEQIRNSKNQRTHAWKRVCSIKEFVYQAIRKEVNFAQWSHLTTSKDNPRSAAEYLDKSQDVEFPNLVPDRHVFAFENGIFNAITCEFHLFDSSSQPENVVACKYFNMPFDTTNLEIDDWLNIPTPTFQSILKYQELGDEVCAWVYLLLGRLIYKLGERDHWEVLPFFKGRAGTGKSTIGKVAADLYEPTDVGILSSNVEKKFGLSSLYDKNIWICYEVKQNFGLDQAEFQCMISGEGVSVAIKHEKAVSMEWAPPGLMCGNEFAGYVDTQGSIGRRLLVIEFVKKVADADADPDLKKKLKKEMPAILLKIARAYNNGIEQYGKQSIWDAVPDYFRLTQQNLMGNADPLLGFLQQSDSIVRGPHLYLPLTRFKELYNTFCHTNNQKQPRWNLENVRCTFDQQGIQIQHQTKHWEAQMVTGDFVMGVGLPNALGSEEDEKKEMYIANVTQVHPGSKETTKISKRNRDNEADRKESIFIVS